MTGHKKWVTTLSWEPYHKNPECQFLASASKDGDVRIWDTKRAQTSRILSSHSKSVTCVKWGGNGLIYSCSQDRTIKVWRAEDVRILNDKNCSQKFSAFNKVISRACYAGLWKVMLIGLTLWR